MGDKGSRLFIPNHAAATSGNKIAAQRKPAFWINVGVPAKIFPRIQPLSLVSTIEPPAAAPNKPTVITSGIKICIVVIPKLPSPAFRPNAVPCLCLGKKLVIFDIEQAKLPPPMPDRNAQT